MATVGSGSGAGRTVVNAGDGDGAADGPGQRSAGSQIAVIGKAAAAMEAILESSGGLTPSELAGLLPTNLSTAFRLLVSLEQAGWVDRDDKTGRYRLGVKLLQYGDAVREGNGLIMRAEPILLELRDEVGQTVCLSVRSGWGALLLHRLSGPAVDVVAWKPGNRLPYYVGAGPLALLAALTDDDLATYLDLPEERHTRHGALTAEQLREEVRLTRARGWSLNDGALTEGISSIGVAVRTRAGAPLCAISLAGLSSQYRGQRLDDMAAALVNAAGRLARDLAIA
ncbi:IclR family transcriptional regulator [Dactylosporangium sp. CA-092794]|uniref:IclR family transcriptional regulator n=1 Tax=Dactylosporangium sp. CA-092794 TaxID=3239929 RepID=UPI003D940427